VINVGFDMLHQRSGAPDVERLQAVADTEDRFAQVVSILQEQFVGVVARRIGGRGPRMPGLPNFCGSHRLAPGQQDR